jgi:hypothetical protein
MTEKALPKFNGFLPELQEIRYVLGWVVFVIYSWAIRGFFYQLPSLSLYHNFGDIFAVFSYLMAFALLESLTTMLVLLLAALVLPRSWFREGFAYKGLIIILVAAIATIQLNDYLYSLNYAAPPANVIYAGLGITLITMVIFILLFQNILPLQKILLAIEDRFQIFIYIYVPLGILGLTVVLVRILF